MSLVFQGVTFLLIWETKTYHKMVCYSGLLYKPWIVLLNEKFADAKFWIEFWPLSCFLLFYLMGAFVFLKSLLICNCCHVKILDRQKHFMACQLGMLWSIGRRSLSANNPIRWLERESVKLGWSHKPVAVWWSKTVNSCMWTLYRWGFCATFCFVTSQNITKP